MKKGKVIQASKFLVSVLRGDVENLYLCLNQGADVNEDADGYACLHYAIAKDNANTVEIIKILLEAKANINATDKKGRTPLMHSVKKNHLSATQILLDYEADILAQDSLGNDALKNAIISKASPDMIRLLINNGADINSINFNGITPLILAVKFDDDEIVELLIDRRADIHVEDHEHHNALYYAAFNNNLYALQTLLRAGAFKKENPSNHLILTELACATGAYLEEGILSNLEMTVKDFDKVTTFMKIAHYLIVYGSDIKLNQGIFTFLATYSPSIIYHLSTQNPPITLTATANMLCTFLDYVQAIELIEKSHIDATFAIFKIFEILKPICVPKALEDLRVRIYTEAIDSKNWELQIMLVDEQNIHNLTKNKEGIITLQPDATFDLNALIPYLEKEFSEASKAKNVFYIINEMNLLKASIDNLNQTEAYKDAFCNLLDQLNQIGQKGELLLMQKQLKYLIPPLTAQMIGNFEIASEVALGVGLNEMQDLKSFFVYDEEITILEYKTQLADNTLEFTITLSLPYEESCYSHYGQICKKILARLQSFCQTDQIINKEIRLFPPNDKYLFPGDVINKVLGFLTRQEYFQVAVTGKQIFPELCSKIIEQYNELKQVEHYQEASLEEQMQHLQISGDLPNEYTI